MRGRRQAAVLLVLTAFAAAACLLVPDCAETEERTFYQLAEEEEITRIQLKNENGDLQFTRADDGQWTVKEKKEYRADKTKLELLTDILTDFTVTRVLEEEKEEYGFSEICPEVSFTTTSGNTHTFFVGGDTMTRNHVYIKDPDTGQTAITGKENVTLLDGGLSAFRSREIFTVDPRRITGVCLEKEGEPALSLELKDGGWMITSPYQAPAREIEMAEFLAELKDWNVYGFADTSTIGPEAFGALGQTGFLTLRDSLGNEQTLKIGIPDGMAVPVQNGGEDDILLLYADEVNLDILKADKLLFFAPLKAGIDEVSKIVIEIGTGKLEFQTDSSAGTFTCNGRPVDSEAFYSFYVSYIGMTAAGADSAESVGGAETLASFTTVFRDGSETTLGLAVRDETTCHMIVNNSPSGFYLNREKITALMEKMADCAGGY